MVSTASRLYWTISKERHEMRTFIVACAILVGIAVGAAAILDEFVQQSATVAFAEPSARI
jgi:hypothetical protein